MISAGSGKNGQGNGTRVLVKPNAWRRTLALAQATGRLSQQRQRRTVELRTAKNKAHLNIKGLKVGANRLNRKAAKRVVGMNERSCPKFSCAVSRTRLTAVFVEHIHEVNHVLA
jgi:CYTH domain-containing protein